MSQHFGYLQTNWVKIGFFQVENFKFLLKNCQFFFWFFFGFFLFVDDCAGRECVIAEDWVLEQIRCRSSQR